MANRTYLPWLNATQRREREQALAARRRVEHAMRHIHASADLSDKVACAATDDAYYILDHASFLLTEIAQTAHMRNVK